MLKTYWRLISQFERLGDNALIIAAFFLSYKFRGPALDWATLKGWIIAGGAGELAPIQEYFVVLGFSLPLFNGALSILGAYRSMRFSSLLGVFRICVFSGAVSFLCLGAILYLLKLDLSRSFVGLFCASAVVFIFLERVVVLLLLRFYRGRGRNFRNVLIVGTGTQAKRLFQEIAEDSELGIRIVGFVDVTEALPEFLRKDAESVDSLPAPIVADSESFEGALKRYAIDEVLFTDVTRSFAVVEDLALLATEEGISVSLAADLFSLEIARSDISYFGETPLIHYRRTPGDTSALALKRLIDLLLAVLALIALSPFLLLTALAIKLDSPGSVLFSQRRVGLNGRIFTLYKFRSMVADAEAQLAQLRGKNEMSGPVFKIKEDPRITRVGRFIRRFSIDELPQLWNVLTGEMSLVGPRPPLPEEVSLYMRKHRRRLSMRPGITCTWQVSGRNNIPDFDEWARLDLEYIDNWSLKRDLALLLRTIPAVLSGSGAR